MPHARHTRHLHRSLVAAAFFAFAAAVSPRLDAQFESSALAKIQVNVVNPGGKSLAMGGAFVSLADDATAAFANPAGLAQLGSFQVGASVKGFRFQPDLDSRIFARRTQGSGEAFVQVGSVPFEETSTVTDVDFLSVVVPVVPEKLTLSVYRAIDLRYRYELDQPKQQFSVTLGDPGQDDSPFAIAEQGRVDIRNEVLGLALGTRLRLGSVPLDLGAGLTFSKLHFLFDGPGGAYLSRFQNFEPTATDVPIRAEADSSWKPGFSVGFRTTLDEVSRFSLGGVYRKNGRHDVNYSVLSPFDLACGKPNDIGYSGCGTFKSPDDFAFGASGGFGGFTASVEFQRILYSQLNEGFVGLYRYSESNDAGTNFAVPVASSDDATALRAGLEYAFEIGATDRLFLRAGYFHESAHGMKLALKKDNVAPLGVPDDGTDYVFTTLPIDKVLKGVFDGGESQEHVTAGLGVTISRSFSIDLAYDWSKRAQYASVSMFYRF